MTDISRERLIQIGTAFGSIVLPKISLSSIFLYWDTENKDIATHWFDDTGSDWRWNDQLELLGDESMDQIMKVIQEIQLTNEEFTELVKLSFARRLRDELGAKKVTIEW